MSLLAVSAESLSLSKAVNAVFYLNYDGSTAMVFWKAMRVCNIDLQQLKAEMKTFKADATVLNILNPEHTLIMSGELQSYPNLQTVMRLALTLSVSSATCERSFSAWSAWKNYLRSTMLLDRFSALSLLKINMTLLEISILLKMIEEFSHSSHTSRRMQLE